MNTLRLIILAAIWGGSFLFMRVGAPVFGPAALIELRVGIAALFLLAAAWWMHRPPPAPRHWRHFLFVGLFNAALPFLMYGYAAQTLSASLLSILNATAPLFGAVIAAAWLRAPVTRAAALGLMLGVAGVAVLVGGDAAFSDAHWWLAVAAGLVAPLSYGISSNYAKITAAKVSPFDNAHGSMWAATLMVLPLVWAVPVRGTPSGADWAAVTALGTLCTGAAFLIYFRLIRDVGPVRALSVTFLIPVFGVLWGALFLHEPVGWSTLIGGSIVLLGTALTNGLVPTPRKAAVDA